MLIARVLVLRNEIHSDSVRKSLGGTFPLGWLRLLGDLGRSGCRYEDSVVSCALYRYRYTYGTVCRLTYDYIRSHLRIFEYLYSPGKYGSNLRRYTKIIFDSRCTKQLIILIIIIIWSCSIFTRTSRAPVIKQVVVVDVLNTKSFTEHTVSRYRYVADAALKPSPSPLAWHPASCNNHQQLNH